MAESKQDLFDHAISLSMQIDGLLKCRESILDRWCVLACPHKVGDIVECAGYSYAGKKTLIEKIGWRIDWNGKPTWRVFGRLLNKDGQPGKISVDWESRK